MLRTLKQGDRRAEEHIQDFRKAAIGSEYEGRALIEEFKRSLCKPLRERLMMAENVPTTIDQWYTRALAYDRNYRNMIAEQKLYGGTGVNRGPSSQSGSRQPGRVNAPQPGANFGGPQGGQRAPAFAPAPPNPRPWNSGPVIPQGVPMEVDRGQRQSVRCYRCGRPGHIAKNCRTQDQGNRIRTTQGIRVMSLEEVRTHFAPNADQNSTGTTTEEHTGQQDFHQGEQ